jgi:hypothetical protein
MMNMFKTVLLMTVLTAGLVLARLDALVQCL